VHVDVLVYVIRARSDPQRNKLLSRPVADEPTGVPSDLAPAPAPALAPAPAPVRARAASRTNAGSSFFRNSSFCDAITLPLIFNFPPK